MLIYKENIINNIKENQKRYYLNNKDKITKYNNSWIIQNPAKYLFNTAQQRAKRKGIEFSIKVEDIKIPEYCPYLNIPLTNTRGEFHVQSNLSLDRIDSTIGYIPGNIQVISHLANSMKQNATKEQLMTFAKGILRVHS